MARTIIVDEIKKDEAATAMSVDGVAKAWANLNGTGTIAIRDSLNVSSITDNGTGDTTLNYTNNMLNGSYVVTGAAQFSETTINDVVTCFGLKRGAPLSANSCRTQTVGLLGSSTGGTDCEAVLVSIKGDLA